MHAESYNISNKIEMIEIYDTIQQISKANF